MDGVSHVLGSDVSANLETKALLMDNREDFKDFMGMCMKKTTTR